MLWIVYKEASNILLKLLVVCAVNGKTLVEIPDSEGNEPFIGVLQLGSQIFRKIQRQTPATPVSCLIKKVFSFE